MLGAKLQLASTACSNTYVALHVVFDAAILSGKCKGSAGHISKKDRRLMDSKNTREPKAKDLLTCSILACICIAHA